MTTQSVDITQTNPASFTTVSNTTVGNDATNYGNEGRHSISGVNEVSGGYRIKSYEYPLSKNNDHYVIFNINLTEESRLIKSRSVDVVGPVDNSGQNRNNTNTTTSQAVGGITTAAGAAAASPVVAGALTSIFAATPAAAAISVVGAAAVTSSVPTTSPSTSTPTTGNATTNAIGTYLSNTFGFTNKLMRLAAAITLYTPSTVNVQYGFDYSIVDNNLLAILAQEKNYESLTQGIKNTSQWGENLEKILQVGAATNDTASLLSKRAVNKRKDVMFKGVSQRQFGFEYVFAPRNAAEAEEVAGIIFTFKYFAHPELSTGYMNFLYTYPAEFDIEYGQRILVDNNLENTRNINMNKISSCVLVGMNVNYSPNGSFQTLEKGEPCIVTMSLQFQEIETLHRDRIGLGY